MRIIKALAILLFVPHFLAAAELPTHLSQTGLYEDIAKQKIAIQNRSYTPQYPLWSDGAKKERWIYLPPNTQINTGNASGGSRVRGNVDYWVFPVGTRFWKQFAFPASDGRSLRRIETRYLEKAEDSTWLVGTYLWNEGQTEAVLASKSGLKDYYAINSETKYDIPSSHDCAMCHKKGGDWVLGFDALQLSTDRDSMAVHAEAGKPGDLTLKKLADEKRITYLSPKLYQNPPKIIASSREGRAAMGYLHGNCGHCHNPSGLSGFTQLFFRYPTETATQEASPAFSTAVDQACSDAESNIPGQPECWRIKSGYPEQSSIPYRMRLLPESNHRMPFVGTKVPDQAAIHLVEEWIRQLPK